MDVIDLENEIIDEKLFIFTPSNQWTFLIDCLFQYLLHAFENLIIDI